MWLLLGTSFEQVQSPVDLSKFRCCGPTQGFAGSYLQPERLGFYGKGCVKGSGPSPLSIDVSVERLFFPAKGEETHSKLISAPTCRPQGLSGTGVAQGASENIPRPDQ